MSSSEPGSTRAQGSGSVVVVGDSYTGGSGEGGTGDDGWTALTWARIRADGLHVEPQVSGQGGSGYVFRGTAGTTFPEEARRLVTRSDQLIVFFGGMNDKDVEPSALRRTVAKTLADTKEVAPCARLVVVAPAWPNADPVPTIIGVRNVLREQAEQAGATFVDPIAERWFADTPQLIGRDHVHPTNAGHRFMADRLEPVLDRLLGMDPLC